VSDATADPALDLHANADRFSGFADLYDEVRPTPPDDLAQLLCAYARVEPPELVVDLGSGSGLSTRWAAGWAGRVVGVEPNADMRTNAERTRTRNVEFVDGLSHQTGLPDGCADLVVAVQALHWMEPVSTFAEAARILRPGGVFAAIDCDWPPVVGDAEVEAAWDQVHARARRGEDALATGLRGDALIGALDDGQLELQTATSGWDAQPQRVVAVGVRRWGKGAHLQRMNESGAFRWTREISLHRIEPGSADRFVDLLRSQGGLQTLYAHGVDEDTLGVTALESQCRRRLGSGPLDLYFTYRVRVGVV
jgi:SAM-dependent methyltransferase